jgi:hypothetical protein
MICWRMTSSLAPATSWTVSSARAILDEAAAAAELHRARCSFRKVPGRVYHLYRRDPDELYFSMLSPDDWDGAPPHPFEGSYRLEVDQTFTRVGDVTR